MASIKLRFRAHRDDTKKGALYFQIVHERAVRQVGTGCRICACEWDGTRGDIVGASSAADIRNRIAWERRKLQQAVKACEDAGKPYTAGDVVERYREAPDDRTTVFGYMARQSERLERLGRLRTSETYRQTLNSFMKFRRGIDLYFDMLDADVVEQYESHMRSRGLSRNTTSFYMRILRCVYNRAVGDGLAAQSAPFKRVYTGVDKTAKRTISLKEIKLIKEMDLSAKPALDYARDLFMFSFYMRGMAFIDVAYLRKKDLSNGYVSYIRRKTGQQLVVRWEESMQRIIDKYGENPTQYLLPIITEPGATERKQYLNKILFVNRKLKQIARLAKIPIPLSMYVSRHSWASIARSKNVPLSVISEAMGHDSEETTRIYLAAMQANRIDEANSRILRGL